ncbi:restriction endonuclease subunit S [Schaalia turicensis]|uniref:restriction endonuclease subunit S n=1 Tax=Schaalia turicensis TaxID=131111 RepID=UPI001C5E3EA2|nr:restriction endonuclease subunit S [Schaalia turicensis]QYB16312.1 hypothetical protein G5S47_05265 [Schaalia turicensis]
MTVVSTRLKNVASVTLGKMLQSQQKQPTDILLPYARAASIGQSGVLLEDSISEMWFSPDEVDALTLQKDDLLVVEGGDVGRSIILPRDYKGWGFQNSVNRVRVMPDIISAKYLYYDLSRLKDSGYLLSECNAVSFAHLTAEKLSNLHISFPPIDQQNRIVRYLDEHTAKIDQLVEKQHQLIALAESRLRIKAERLAWGLGRSDRGTKSPIVEPPSGWVSIKNKALLKHVDVRSVTGEEELLSVSHITGVTPRTMKNVNMFEAESNVGYKLVEPGQLAINTMWAWMGALGVSEYSGIVSPSYDVYQFRDNDQVEGKYFDLAYRTQTYVDLMRANSRGIWSSRLRLYPEVFLSLPMVVPPLLEQKRIAAHYEEARADAEKLVITTQRAIDLALERRSVLVTAAVTGQIQV